MKTILIIGSGAREHAIAKAFARSAVKPTLYCLGTHRNPGIEQLTKQYALTDMTNTPAMVKQAREWGIELAIVGPELPLACGIVDHLQQVSIKSVGPTQALAQLETSKAFTRHLLNKYQISGSPRYRHFYTLNGAADFLNDLGDDRYVVKADGLTGGKGVKVAGDHLFSIEDAHQFCESLIAEKSSFVIEEKIIGQEFSLLFFVDNETLIPMPLVQDHKRAYVGDAGPNTGGMGSYSDANHRLPFITQHDVEKAIQITQQVIDAMRREGHPPYRGILYGSFMASAQGIYLIEYNVRFGDPESINLLALLDTDFSGICEAIVTGNLTANDVRFKPLASVCKYAVPQGYPHSPELHAGLDIDAVKDKQCLFFGSVRQENNQLITLGSRAIAVLGMGETIDIAETRAEQEIRRIHGDFFYREDIGTSDLIKQRIAMMDNLRC